MRVFVSLSFCSAASCDIFRLKPFFRWTYPALGSCYVTSTHVSTTCCKRVGSRRDEGGGMRDEVKNIAFVSSLIPPPSSLLYPTQLKQVVLTRCPHSIAINYRLYNRETLKT